MRNEEKRMVEKLEGAPVQEGRGSSNVEPQGEKVRKQASKDVFSLRLSAEELDQLKRAADMQRLPMAELVRAAVRSYLLPGQATWAAVSFGAVPGTQLSSSLPIWSGGRMATVPDVVQESREAHLT